jgi:hypothetical protein
MLPIPCKTTVSLPAFLWEAFVQSILYLHTVSAAENLCFCVARTACRADIAVPPPHHYSQCASLFHFLFAIDPLKFRLFPIPCLVTRVLWQRCPFRLTSAPHLGCFVILQYCIIIIDCPFTFPIVSAPAISGLFARLLEGGSEGRMGKRGWRRLPLN